MPQYELNSGVILYIPKLIDSIIVEENSFYMPHFNITTLMLIIVFSPEN